MVHEICIGEQNGWYHDEGHTLGVFHTYDTFTLNGMTRKIHIYIPRSILSVINEDLNVSYPSLFVLDGQIAFFPEKDDQSLYISELLDKIGNNLNIIVVGIHASIDRDHEYLHEEVTEGIGGGLKELLPFICDFVQDLIPWLCKHYKISNNPNLTTIMGGSHGGLAAFYLATRRNDIFGYCICLSPSFWAGLDSSVENPMLAFENISKGSIINDIIEDLQSKIIRPLIYFDWGMNRIGFENEYTEALVEKRCKEMKDFLENELNYTNDELLTFEDPNGSHSAKSWAARLDIPLKWLESKYSKIYYTSNDNIEELDS